MHRIQMNLLKLILEIIVATALFLMPGSVQATEPQGGDGTFEIRLWSRQFTPPQGVEPKFAQQLKESLQHGDNQHVYVQFVRPPGVFVKEQLNAVGLNLLQFVGSATWHAVLCKPAVLSEDVGLLNGQFGVRWIGPIPPVDKESPYLKLDWGKESRLQDGLRQLIVHFFSDISITVARKLCEELGMEVLAELPFGNQLILAAPDNRIRDIAELDTVSWIEPVPPPGRSESDRARGYIQVDDVTKYNGQGVNIGVFEDGHVADGHHDLMGRVTMGDTDMKTWDYSQHATMTGGFIAGDGNKSMNAKGSGKILFQYRGMAPGSHLITYDFEVGEASTWADRYSNYLGDLYNAINKRDIDIGNNSWGTTGGCSTIKYGEYTELCDDLDLAVAGASEFERPLIIVFSAGNERHGFENPSTNSNDTSCLVDKNLPFNNYYTLNHPKSAKNVIVVGAVDSHNDRMTAYSSWGPTNDGRIKPEVVAAGHHNGALQLEVTEIDNRFGNPVGAPNQQDYRAPNDDFPPASSYWYGWYSETSASAAATSGAIALLLEAYRKKLRTELDPLPSTVRALLVQTARDLDDNTTWYNRGPDYASGFGVVQINDAIDLIEKLGHVIEGKIDSSRPDRYTLDVPTGTKTLKLTLAWDDPAPAPAATNILVNDLDLVVTDPDGNRYYPWTLDPALPGGDAVRTSADRHNNLEQVEIDTSLVGDTLPEGIWEISVRPHSLPERPQRYSLVSSGRLKGAVDVMLVLDRSGSMNEMASAGMPDTKIETLRTAIIDFVDVMLVDQGYRLGLVQFNEDVVPFPAGSEDALDLHTTLRANQLKTGTVPSITAGGRTSIGDGLREAHNQFTSSPSPSDIDRVVLLLTDGKENESEWISDVRSDLITDDVTVNVLGLGYGSGIDELKLVDLASDTNGTYRITADHLAFRKLFIETLSGVVDWSLVTDPVGHLSRNQETAVSFTLTSDETYATISTVWQGVSGAIELSLISPSGKVVKKSTKNRYIRYTETAHGASFQLDFPLAGDLNKEWAGQWKVKIVGSQKIDQGVTVRHTTSVLAKGGVRLNVEATPTSGFAGEPIQILARLTRAMAPIKGAKIEVIADVPLVAVGDILAEYMEPIDREFFNGDSVSLVAQKLNKLIANGVELKRETQQLRLFDDGKHNDGKPNDGVYGNVFKATKTPGSYGFHVVASGISAGRVHSTRESYFDVYCGVRPHPQRSEIKITQTDKSSFKVRFAPRDIAGHLLGPGHTIQGVLMTSDRRLPIPFKDGLDGNYTGSFVVSREYQEEKAQVELLINHHSFTKVDLPR